jgi:hypothetical protein
LRTAGGNAAGFVRAGMRCARPVGVWPLTSGAPVLCGPVLCGPAPQLVVSRCNLSLQRLQFPFRHCASMFAGNAFGKVVADV